MGSLRSVERYWLLYTPVWGAAVGIVMLAGLAERWGDTELITLGVVLALGAVAPPILSEKGDVLSRVATKLSASVVGFAFLMNYYLTPYFFDVLHMHYGFRTEINIENNPVFLYFMTVPYFATYSVLIAIGYRRALTIRPPPLRALAVLLVPGIVAALETALNANPFMRSLFCFDDLGLMLTFGTASYGVALGAAMPVWVSIDEDVSIGVVILRTLGAMMVIVILFDLSRHFVAPHLTTVVTGAVGLRDFGSSCLAPMQTLHSP